MPNIFGRSRRTSDDHDRILDDITKLLVAAAEAPELEDEALYDRLVREGIERDRGVRLVLFVPIAFGRHVVNQFGVPTPTTYIERNQSGREKRRRLRDVPEYRAAEDHISDFYPHPGFKVVALWSAEVSLINGLLEQGESPEGGTLSELVLWGVPHVSD